MHELHPILDLCYLISSFVYVAAVHSNLKPETSLGLSARSLELLCFCSLVSSMHYCDRVTSRGIRNAEHIDVIVFSMHCASSVGLILAMWISYWGRMKGYLTPELKEAKAKEIEDGVGKNTRLIDSIWFSFSLFLAAVGLFYGANYYGTLRQLEGVKPLEFSKAYLWRAVFYTSNYLRPLSAIPQFCYSFYTKREYPKGHRLMLPWSHGAAVASFSLITLFFGVWYRISLHSWFVASHHKLLPVQQYGWLAVEITVLVFGSALVALI